ncbi:MAG: NAD-dependent 4,6-dehydratase LegB [Polynucleobacter sp.]|nr:NAD-dependent 4,6-dehydratase LegB [Polynucleobacter sp.]
MNNSFSVRGPVLVTGADGFIGSHLVEALVKGGWQVKAFVQYNSLNSWGWLDSLPKEIIDSLEVFSGDIRDPNGVRVAVKGCTHILHLAALIAIPYSYHSPDAYVDTNVKGTLNILHAARDFNIEKMVHTSTSEVYGTAKYVPIDENHPLCGQSPYSASKIAADQLAYSFYASFGVPVTIIRPFNTYGPRQSARAVIPAIITQIASGATEIKLGALSPTRDFSYIDDTVRGFIASLEAKNIIGEIINLGSNFEITIGETANMIAGIMGVKIKIISDELRFRPQNSEVDRLWANNSRARELLKWSPEYFGEEGFRSGLVKTIDWLSDPTNLGRYKSGIYNI